MDKHNMHTLDNLLSGKTPIAYHSFSGIYYYDVKFVEKFNSLNLNAIPILSNVWILFNDTRITDKVLLLFSIFSSYSDHKNSLSLELEITKLLTYCINYIKSINPFDYIILSTLGYPDEKIKLVLQSTKKYCNGSIFINEDDKNDMGDMDDNSAIDEDNFNEMYNFVKHECHMALEYVFSKSKRFKKYAKKYNKLIINKFDMPLPKIVLPKLKYAPRMTKLKRNGLG